MTMLTHAQVCRYVMLISAWLTTLSLPVDLDYLFGVYSGILFTSTFYVFVYSAITGNKPKIYANLIFPGLISGILWGIAMGMVSHSITMLITLFSYNYNSGLVSG